MSASEQVELRVEDGAADVLSTPAEYWFALAKWAKDANHYNGFVRRFLFNVGVLKSTGKTLSEKQVTWAAKLMRESATLGFVPPSAF